jgi:hypothetical protein
MRGYEACSFAAQIGKSSSWFYDVTTTLFREGMVRFGN